MLIVMTFNVGFLVAAVGGYMLGTLLLSHMVVPNKVRSARGQVHDSTQSAHKDVSKQTATLQKDKSIPSDSAGGALGHTAMGVKSKEALKGSSCCMGFTAADEDKWSTSTSRRPLIANGGCCGGAEDTETAGSGDCGRGAAPHNTQTMDTQHNVNGTANVHARSANMDAATAALYNHVMHQDSHGCGC